MKRLLFASAALAVSFALGVSATAQTFIYNPPVCLPIEKRQKWIDNGFEVSETITQPGIDVPGVVTWEAWISKERDIYGITSRNEDRICVYEEGRGTTPPAIHDRVEDTRGKPLKPRGTAL